VRRRSRRSVSFRPRWVGRRRVVMHPRGSITAMRGAPIPVLRAGRNLGRAAIEELGGSVRRWIQGPTRVERVFLLVEVAILVVGLVLRARGFFFGVRPFWLDECSWAVFLFDGRFGDENLRPIGFMHLSLVLATIFGPWESVLRALPWTAGVVTVLVAPFLARRLPFPPAARLLFVAVLALHPAAIDFSKEFKPYSVSLALHTGLLFLTLRYMRTRRVRELLPVLVVASIGTVLAQDLVFAYPAVFLVLGWEAFKHQRSHLRWVVPGACLVLLSLGVQYALIWSRIPSDESTYWGHKYDVFYTSSHERSFIAWLLDRYLDLVEYPGYRRRWWHTTGLSPSALAGLRSADALFWSLAHGAGLALLALQRQGRLALLILLPLVTLVVFNALHLWPMGAFRTNLFALLYVSVIAAYAFSWSWSGRAAWLGLLPTALLVVAPLVFLERSWHKRKSGQAHDGYLPAAVARVGKLQRAEPAPKPEPLLFGSRICPQWEYYAHVHPHGERLRSELAQSFAPKCIDDERLPGAIGAATHLHTRVWVITQGEPAPETLIAEAQRRGVDVVGRSTVGSANVFGFRRTTRWR